MAKKPQSEKSLKNITDNKAPHWEKGQSGNPAGRPVGSKNRSTIMKELLSLPRIGEDGKPIKNPLDPSRPDMTNEVAVNVKLLQKALDGNLEAIKEIQDSVYGKKPDVVSGDPENPIQHTHQVDGEVKLTGDALKVELAARGLPTEIFQK